MNLFASGLIIGGVIVWLYHLLRYQSVRQRIISLTASLQEDAARLAGKTKAEFDAHTQRSLEEISQERSALLHKENQLKTRTQDLSSLLDQCKKDSGKIESLKKELLLKEEDLVQRTVFLQKKLEEISSLSLEEAKAMLVENAQTEAVKAIENRLATLQIVYEKEANEKAQEFLFSALERKTQSLTKELFLTQIQLENPQIIPVFIGKDGRNIHTLEELLHVKLIIEDNRLLISSHDAKQRFIAHKVLEELLKQGKITLPRITAVYDSVVHNIDDFVHREGKLALQAIDPSASFSHEICTAVGNLTLRSSSGQNVLKHSIEVSELMGIFAAELQLRPKIARLMGIFHDIGKTLSTEYGDSHATAGKTFLCQHQVDNDIVNAVASHHGECVATSEEARLLPICDRLSAQLPGIRSPNEPAFLPMVRQCEEIGKRHPSVLSAWAHYAGSHVELIVRHKGFEKELSLRNQLEAELRTNPIPVHLTLLNITKR